jgi:hypothetical protein
MDRYVETGWSVPERETLHITVPPKLASELQAVAERARSSAASVIVDAISDANKFGWTASRQALTMPPGGIAKQISLDPKIREDLELRLNGIAERGGSTDLSALISAMVVYYLREKLGASDEASAASES